MGDSLMVHFGTAGNPQCVAPQFFGLKPWYEYLATRDDCSILTFNVVGGPAGSDFVLIAMALVDNLLRIAAFVAIGYIIYGGILYIMSQGSPDQTGKAQNTILNAVIGLIIAIVSVALVSFLGNRIA